MEDIGPLCKRPFKFINNLVDHPNFKEIVECALNCVGPFSGPDLEKVKNVKIPLRKLNSRELKNIVYKILAMREKVWEIQDMIEESCWKINKMKRKRQDVS